VQRARKKMIAALAEQKQMAGTKIAGQSSTKTHGVRKKNAAAGLLAQRAARELREDGRTATFIAVRLPYGVQAQENDAEAAVAAIPADQVVRVAIKPAADCLMAAVLASGSDPGPRHHFILGNVKACQRMVTRYVIAGMACGLVIGTDHAAEVLMGY
jgi:NAD+ synthase